jgi:peptidoglycan/xylan/chitin deacetylase (PgdA/CDA1 family)
MGLSLFVNDSLRVSKRIGHGRFLFTNVRLAKGENSVLLKGVGQSDRVYEKALTVRIGREEAVEASAAFQEGTPIVPRRRINYLKAQTFVPDQYASSLNFTRGSRDQKRVALTFDGGAHAREAPDILDTLKNRQVKATFFLTGYFIRKYPDLVRRMHGEGHVLGNHLDSHPHLTTWEENGMQNTRPGVTQAFLADELRKVDERFRKMGIRTSRTWRAPYGEQNRQINQWGESAGYRHVGWTQGTSWRMNLDTNDWVVKPGDPGYFSSAEAIKKILSFGNGTGYGLNGGIVLMHAGTIRKTDKLYRQLGTLIDSLKSRGYELVTATEMMNGAGLNN